MTPFETFEVGDVYCYYYGSDLPGVPEPTTGAGIRSGTIANSDAPKGRIASNTSLIPASWAIENIGKIIILLHLAKGNA
jgi:hypothetical protein